MRNNGCALRSAQGAKARFAKPISDLAFDPALGIALGAALDIALAIPITMPITMAAPVGADASTPARFTLMHFHDSRKIG
jgi:hypothetical protein